MVDNLAITLTMLPLGQRDQLASRTIDPIGALLGLWVQAVEIPLGKDRKVLSSYFLINDSHPSV
jgi:hypothetical protein